MSHAQGQPAPAEQRGQVAPPGGRRRRWLDAPAAAPLLAMALCALVALPGLSVHPFWDDEANTAIFARNLLRSGELTALDGQNLAGFRFGAELDPDLINAFMPPGQYYLAAAGLWLFGESTSGGRLPFVLAGLLCVGLTALWVRRLTGPGPAALFAPLILALSPAFLLFIRNCRYFAPAALCTVGLLAGWSLATAQGRRRRAAGLLLGGLSCAGLVLTQYLSAAGALLALPALLLLRPLRGRAGLVYLAAVYAVAAACGLWVLTQANPLDRPVPIHDPTPWLRRVAVLSFRHIRDLATFEFMPVLLVPLLALPLAVRRLRPLAPLAWRGAVVSLFILLACVMVAPFSPQPLSTGVSLGDMRYLVPLIAVGSCVSGICLALCWRLWRPLGLALGGLVIFSNLLHMGFLYDPGPPLLKRGLSCTLCDYLEETQRGYPTNNAAVVETLGRLPAGAVVLTSPGHLSYSPMFYRPELRYCCQLSSKSVVRAELRSRLPDHLFWERAQVDYALIDRRSMETANPVLHWAFMGPGQRLRASHGGKTRQMGQFEVIDTIDIFDTDRSRPELPWHSFSARQFAGARGRGYLLLRARPSAVRTPGPDGHAGTPSRGDHGR